MYRARRKHTKIPSLRILMWFKSSYLIRFTSVMSLSSVCVCACVVCLDSKYLYTYCCRRVVMDGNVVVITKTPEVEDNGENCLWICEHMFDVCKTLSNLLRIHSTKTFNTYRGGLHLFRYILLFLVNGPYAWCRIQINSYVPLIPCIYHQQDGLWLTTTNLSSVSLRVPFGTGNPGARAWDVRVPPSFLLCDDVSRIEQIPSVAVQSVQRTLSLPPGLIMPTWFHVTFPWKFLIQFCDEEV